MDVEVQLANGEWVPVPASDTDCRRAACASPTDSSRSQERPYATRDDNARQQYFWLAQDGVRRTQTLGINVDIFC